jgi:hypothetical protein
MDERYSIKSCTTLNRFLSKHIEIRPLSFSKDPRREYGKSWVEDKYGNYVLLITSIPESYIIGVRCYVSYDPSYVLFLLIMHEGCLIKPESIDAYVPHYLAWKCDGYEKATAEFLTLLKKTKKYKMWSTKC